MNPIKSNIPSPFDNLFEQAANISKAHGYDILAKQVGELQAENKRLLSLNEGLVEALQDIVNMETGGTRFDVLRIAKAAIEANNLK